VIVSAVLGHASPSFTIAVYQHAWQEGPAEAAQALEAALRPRSGVGNPLATELAEPSEDRNATRSRRSDPHCPAGGGATHEG
jgi:hypothetical protein